MYPGGDPSRLDFAREAIKLNCRCKMKYFKIEPTYKKSVVEFTYFRRPLEELTNNDEDKGKFAFLHKELGWRWGSFMISVPDTEEEIKEFLEERGGYDSVQHYLADYHGEEDIIVESTTLQEYLLPNTEDDFVDLTEDYDSEMLECWDGCWEDWNIKTNGPVLSDVDEMMEKIEEAYNEEYEEGVEELGWEFLDSQFEIHCSVTVVECDEHGQVSEEESIDEEQVVV